MKKEIRVKEFYAYLGAGNYYTCRGLDNSLICRVSKGFIEMEEVYLNYSDFKDLLVLTDLCQNEFK